MTNQYSEPHTAHLFRYVIASADMYYSEMEQRDVFLASDEQGNFRIWGETAEGSSTEIDLCEIFLEYALYCYTWCSTAEAFYHMQDFGEHIGQSLAKYLGNPPPLISENPMAGALECVFKTMDVCLTIEHCESEVRFIATSCPLEKAAERSGLRNVELAHYGINTMCQSLIHAMNPDLTLSASPETGREFIFTILMPAAA